MLYYSDAFENISSLERSIEKTLTYTKQFLDNKLSDHTSILDKDMCKEQLGS